MPYQTIFPSECLGDSLWKINSNAQDFDTRLLSLSGRTPRRSLDDNGAYEIWIDSGTPGGNDATADGTPARPFRTIAAAVSFYGKEVASKGISARFRLSPGTVAQPKVYKGALIYLGHDGVSAGGGALRNKDTASVGDPYQYYSVDRTMYFIGDTNDPRTVVIEPMFHYSRVTGIDFWNAYNLYINFPNGTVIVQGITFRYNAVGNLPGYTGGDQFYNEKTDTATYLVFDHCHYARAHKCRFEQMIDPNLYDVMQPGWTWVGGSVTQPSAKYMFGIAYYNCRFGRITEITVSGTMRYIAKSSGSELAFEAPGQITLENNPRFFGFFEVEGGGSIIIDKTFSGSGYADPNYQLRFTGSGCGAPITLGKSWWNYTFLNFESKWFTPQGGPRPQAIMCPSQGATPKLFWPTNTTHRLMYVDSYYTQTGINNNVFYWYNDSGKTVGTGNPRNV